MAEHFKVGELALVVKSPNVSPELRGEIVEITGLESPCFSPAEKADIPAYRIAWANANWCVKREYLQKLPPPKQDDRADLQKTEWEDGVWAPKSAVLSS